MKVGSEYLVRRINHTSWEALAKSIGVPSTNLLDRVEATVESVTATVDKVRQSAIDEGLEESVVHLLADRTSVNTFPDPRRIRIAMSATPLFGRAALPLGL